MTDPRLSEEAVAGIRERLENAELPDWPSPAAIFAFDAAMLLAERDALIAENEKLRGEWEEVGHRCPMCGTGNLNLVDTEAELARWRAVGERVTVALVNTLTDAGKAWRCEYREMGAEIGEEVPIGLDCETASAILRDLRTLAQGGGNE